VEELIKEMVASDIKLFERDKYLAQGGHKILDQHE
jgi:GDPmannose 4,6-dehydratase